MSFPANLFGMADLPTAGAGGQNRFEIVDALVTPQNNVLFGLPMDEERYREAIQLACLEPDLLSIKGGDQAEIGERGINLSGGQKMRISIARAVYSDTDTIIFDDPLAAVDAHVAASLFYNLIAGKLKSKAILLVTNQLQFLRDTTRIVVLDEGWWQP